MKQKIFDFTKSRQNVSMVELCNNIPGFKGNMTWYVGNNTIFWHSLSYEAIEALQSLMDERRIMIDVVDPIVYLTDGAYSPYPVVKIPYRDTKKPQWVPIVISAVMPGIQGEKEFEKYINQFGLK